MYFFFIMTRTMVFFFNILDFIIYSSHLCILGNCVVYFLIIEFESSLYVFDTNPLLNIF